MILGLCRLMEGYGRFEVVHEAGKDCRCSRYPVGLCQWHLELFH